MMKLTAAVFTAVIALAVNAPAQAQTALKWATLTRHPNRSTPKPSGRRRRSRSAPRGATRSPCSRVPAWQGKRPQPGPDARRRRSHHVWLQLCGPQLSADRRHLLPLHLPQSRAPDRLHQERRVQGLGGWLRKASGHHITAVTYYGTRHTTSNKPIKTCDDLRGIKMRVPDVPAYLAMPKACGANTARSPSPRSIWPFRTAP